MYLDFPSCPVTMEPTQIERSLNEQLAVLNVKVEYMQTVLERLQKQLKELQYVSGLDGLTKLANRQNFNSHLEQQWQRLVDEQAPLSLILCEIDHFKIYTDTRGSIAADDCLLEVAKTMSNYAKYTNAFVARYAEQKFTIILPKTEASHALKMAERIRRKVKNLAIAHDPLIDGLPDRIITVSLGVASTIPDLEDSPFSLLLAAENALDRSKRKGRDRTSLNLTMAMARS